MDYPSPNWSPRAGRPIRALVIHVTAGIWPSDRDWLCNPASKVSAHYIVAPDGVSYQLVDEKHAAWGNGIMNKPNLALPVVAAWRATPHDPSWPAGLPNLESVSIEVSAIDGSRWTAAQRATVVSLGRQICTRHRIGALAILRHADLDSVDRPNCPGLSRASWAALMLDIAGGIVPNPYWEQVGAGIRDAMRAAGDEPVGAEVYAQVFGADWLSKAPGKLGLYVYDPAAKRVAFLAWR